MNRRGALVSTVEGCESLGLCRRSLEAGEESKEQQGKATISDDTRKLGFGEYAEWAYVEVITQASIRAGSSRTNQCPMPEREKAHRSDSMAGCRNRNVCKHGRIRMSSGERAYRMGGIWIPDNFHVISIGKPFR